MADQDGIWHPDASGRLVPKSFHTWSFRPNVKSAKYSPPKRKAVPQRTPTALDSKLAAVLRAKVASWEAEADRLENGAEMKETLKDRLALLMFKVDVPLQIRKQEKEWDPKGDGTITKVWCLSSLAWLARTYAFASAFASDAREQTSGIRGA